MADSLLITCGTYDSRGRYLAEGLRFSIPRHISLADAKAISAAKKGIIQKKGHHPKKTAAKNGTKTDDLPATQGGGRIKS